jgi:hypothetical protein
MGASYRNARVLVTSRFAGPSIRRYRANILLPGDNRLCRYNLCCNLERRQDPR